GPWHSLGLVPSCGGDAFDKGMEFDCGLRDPFHPRSGHRRNICESQKERSGAPTKHALTTNGFSGPAASPTSAVLCYYRALYYHPTLQRFISEDPIDFAVARSLGDGC